MEAICLNIVGITHPELTVHLHRGASQRGFAIQKEQNEKVGIGVNTKGAEEEEQDHLQFLFNQLFSSCSSIPATTFLGSGGGTEGLHSTGDPQLGHTWIAREGGIQHVI